MNLSSLLTLLGFLFFRAQSIDHKHSKASFESNTNLSVQRIPYSSIYKVGSEKYVDELNMHKRKVISGQETKSFVRLLPSRGNSKILVTMWFMPWVRIGIESRVRIETNPERTGLIFYMYVANTCKRNQYTLHCERTNSGDSNHKENYLEGPIIKRMSYIGNGFYEEIYTISHTKTGYVSVSTYQMRHGVRGLCYDNENFLGPPVKTFIGNQIAYDWGNKGLCGGGPQVKGLMFRGRLLAPETRRYQLRASDGILIRFAIIRHYEEKDFKSNGHFVPLCIGQGDYDYVIYIKAKGKLIRAMVYWEILSSSTLGDGDLCGSESGTSLVTPERVLVPNTSFLYVVLTLTPNNIEITCFLGHYFSVAMNTCLKCSKGTYTNQYGLIECIMCDPGTFNEEGRGITCKQCPAMTYGDRFGFTKCTPCPPLCSECFGPYNTQCNSCVESTGVLFISPNTCQCPDGTYYESYLDKCTHCHLLCSSCTGPSSTQCKGCNTPIAYEVESLPSLCVTECPESYYKDFSTCKCTFLF